MEIDQNDFKQLISLLQKLVENSDAVQTKNNDHPTSTDEAPTKKVNKRRKTNNQKSVSKSKGITKEFHNKFLQMPEARMHTEDIEIDKKLNKFPPTSRGRKYTPINVRCRICGKNEEVNPSLVESLDRYKCNKCCSIPG
jgi:ribosomal protein L31E